MSVTSQSNSLADLSILQLYDLLALVTLHRDSPRSSFTNWGLTYTCRPLAVFEPDNEYLCRLVLELAKREGKTLRAAGVGHSPSDLTCTRGFMLRTDKLDKILEVHVEKRYVVAQAGITLHNLHIALAEHGLAMINVGSISDQTLGGIVTTATHGSGINYGVISTNVMALRLLLADGSCVQCSRDERPELFLASICGLGSTGLILSVQLEVEPAFRLEEKAQMLSFDESVERMEEFIFASEHVRYWWFPSARRVRVSASNRTMKPARPVYSWLWHSLLGHHVIQFMLYLGTLFPALIPWIGRFAAWLVSDPSVAVDDGHRIFNLDCRYPHYTTEWAIPYERTRPCLLELRAWLEDELANPQGLRFHFPIEVRWSDADDIWLSPSTGQRTCWIGIIQYKPYGLTVPYRELFERFEAILARHGGRPHWAKAHKLRPDALRRLYPRFDDFIRIVDSVDPTGLFRNEYVERHLFGKQGPEVDARVFERR